MPDWDSPKWRKEGRTGPGPIAPRYAKASDRNKVRRGKQVGSWKGDSNPGGPGRRTRRIQTGGGSKPPKDSGCRMAALVILGGLGTLLTGAVWGAYELGKAIL